MYLLKFEQSILLFGEFGWLKEKLVFAYLATLCNMTQFFYEKTSV